MRYFNDMLDLGDPSGAQPVPQTLLSQISWLIGSRWIAIMCIGLIGALSTTVLPILSSALPIYVCAAILLVSNIFYKFLSKSVANYKQAILLILWQMEFDLIILSILLLLTGGTRNPFILFYAFHIILGAIILSRGLSLFIAISAVILFILMTLCEQFKAFYANINLLTSNIPYPAYPDFIYAFWSFTAFTGMVLLTRYLTQNVIMRMRAKELEAARNHNLLMTVIDAMGEGLIFLDSKGNIGLTNQAAHEWVRSGFGKKRDCSIKDFPAQLMEHMNKLLEQTYTWKATRNTICFDATDNKQRYLETISCPVVGKNHRHLGWVIVGQDVTERQKMEDALRKRNEEITRINNMLRTSQMEMAHREKMSAIGQMASGIAHEIGNPLASLSSLTQYLNRKLTDQFLKSKIQLINHQVTRIANILKKLIDMSQPMTHTYTWVDVEKIVNDTLSLIQFDKRAQGLTIKTTYGNDMPSIWTKRDNLEQVLLNVLLNALDALAVASRHEEKILEIKTLTENDQAIIQISDNGIGMDPEILSHAFEPFFSTKEPGKGTGQGLYISRNLIAEINGTIILQSQENEGTTVKIVLPCHNAGKVLSQKDLV